MEESRLVWVPPGYEKAAEKIIAAQREVTTADVSTAACNLTETFGGKTIVHPTTIIHREWPRPIPVNERLPAEQDEYLCFARKTKGSLQKWRMALFIPLSESKWFDAVSEYTLRDVTHWLPLPPNPE